MQPYQEEYIANLRQIAALAVWRRPEDQSFEDYAARLSENEAQMERTARRNMELLRTCLFPVLDDLLGAGEEELRDLEEFAGQLYDGRTELDVGLFCQIRQSLLALARHRQDQAATIRGLYWLGMGRYSLCIKLVGLELEDVQEYMARMRLCFTEAAAYLKFFDEIDDDDTRGYILRSRANISLGQFSSPGERVRLLQKTLYIMQDKAYQAAAPALPWDRYIYMTHQNMASSIPYREDAMTADEFAAIMESVYIVYQRRIYEAEESHTRLPARAAFAYCSVKFYCGIEGVDQLFTQVEELLDGADPEDFSPDGLYAMVSLPAFYCQYLRQYPQRLAGREGYVEGLYQRVLDYMAAYPGTEGDGALFQYLRQLSYTFIETGHSIPYGEFLQKLMLRFAPELYIHSWTVGEAARTLCGIVIEDDPGFFDDIEELRAIADPEEKRRETLEFARCCGLFHDVGKFNVVELYRQTARQWFEEEYRMAQLHTVAGDALLSPRPSTQRYAAAALGHHAWYDGSNGYPARYKRLACPSRQMVDVIALVSWLEDVTNPVQMHTGSGKGFDEAVEGALALEGRRFSPLLTARLRDRETVERLREGFRRGRQEGCRRMYEGGQ